MSCFLSFTTSLGCVCLQSSLPFPAANIDLLPLREQPHPRVHESFGGWDVPGCPDPPSWQSGWKQRTVSRGRLNRCPSTNPWYPATLQLLMMASSTRGPWGHTAGHQPIRHRPSARATVSHPAPSQTSPPAAKPANTAGHKKTLPLTFRYPDGLGPWLPLTVSVLRPALAMPSIVVGPQFVDSTSLRYPCPRCSPAFEYPCPCVSCVPPLVRILVPVVPLSLQFVCAPP